MWALVKFVKLYLKTNWRSSKSFVVWPELTCTLVQKGNNILVWVLSCQQGEPVYPPKTSFIKTRKLGMACPALTLHLKGDVFLPRPPPHRLWQAEVTAHRTWAAACSQSGGENLEGRRTITIPMQHNVLRVMIAICKFLTTVMTFKGVDIWMPFNLTERSIQWYHASRHQRYSAIFVSFHLLTELNSRPL